jgi:integrase
MASTRLNEMGMRPDLVEAQLAHKDPDAVRMVYNRAEYLSERREMMQTWADYLDGLRQNCQHLTTSSSMTVSTN